MSDAILELAFARGVLPRWTDLAGVEHVTTRETAMTLLRAMGTLDADADDSTARTALLRLEQENARRPLPRTVVVDAGAAASLALSSTAQGSPPATLFTEDGGETALNGPGVIDLPPLPLGYHHIRTGGAETLVIAAPARAPSIPALTGRNRIWGATTAIHALHRTGHPAPGDLSDLLAAAEALAPLGADFIGFNPIHALGAANSGPSPYSPAHRGFLDTRIIAPSWVPGFAGCAEAQALSAARPGLDDGLIDHARATAWRYAVLAALHAAFQNLPGGAERAAFDAFREAQGEPLARFAAFEATSCDTHHPAGPAARDPGFHAWLQWLADTQLARTQAGAKAAGMALGLFTDLAVGVRPEAAEVATEPGLFATGVSLGAPPDQFSPDGQSWGLAPYVPHVLEDRGFAPFIATIRAAIDHAGLVRIDHILGFDRSFWAPEDGGPGGYVRMPSEAMMAIVRIEATRAGAAVVGEDLGVVPEGLRERMAASGLHGSAVMQFERDHAGAFLPPAAYRPFALTSFGTHDTPTLAGWWTGRDLDWAAHLGRLDPAGEAVERTRRHADRQALLALLARENLLPPDLDPAIPPAAPGEDLLAALHALAARTPSAIAAIQLDDALGTIEQPNIPGTVGTHPNWRRPLAVPVDVLAGNPALAAVTAAMRRERPREGRDPPFDPRGLH